MNTSNVKVTPCNNFRPQLWKENVCRECFCLKERHGPKAMIEQKLGANHLNERDPEEVFEIVELLGTGSYGDVYLGRNIDTNQNFALKFIPLQKADEQEVSTIVNEINIIRETFECPYIVEYHGVYMKDQTIMVVMEYCTISAEDILNFCPEIEFTEDEIAAVCAGVVKALAFLHAYKICHRDIKSGNILLKPTGEVKIADFGISHKLQDGKEKMNTLAGSPYWCSPELITHSSYTNKVDIWATGIVAIELAERRPPHWDMEPMQVIFHIPKQPPPSLKEKTKWSPVFHNFLGLCLKKDPNERPPARDLLSHEFILRGSSSQILEAIVRKALPLVTPRKQESLKEDLNQTSEEVQVSTGTVVTVDKASKTIKATIPLEPGATTKFESFKLPEDQALFYGIPLDSSMAYCEKRKIKHPILQMVQHIKDNCLHADGLFRISAPTSRLTELKSNINSGKEYNLLLFNSHDIANAVKQYFRELPEPLLTFALYDKIIHTQKVEAATKVAYVKAIIAALPPNNRKVLKAFMEICSLLAKNNAGSTSISILVGPCLLWKKNQSESSMVSDISNVNKFVQILIEHYGILFLT